MEEKIKKYLEDSIDGNYIFPIGNGFSIVNRKSGENFVHSERYSSYSESFDRGRIFPDLPTFEIKKSHTGDFFEKEINTAEKWREIV